MRKFILLFSLVTLCSSSFGQVDKVINYINQYKELAINEMIRTGVPASITLAQGILESGCGQSKLAEESNNHFGIKCKPEWTGGKTYKDDDKRDECFRVYATAADSYRDHSNFLKDRPYYTNLFKLNPEDYKAWAYGLKKDGYATERDYPANLIKIIETYHLESYSEVAIQRMKNPDDATNRYANNSTSPTAPTPETPAVSKMNDVATVKSSEVAIPVENKTNTMRVAQTMVSLPSYPSSTFLINDTKVVYAAKGKSLLALASAYHIDYSKLLSINDLKESAVISKGQLIYLQRKPSKGGKEIYTSQYGETLRDISNKMGVELKSLIRFNGLSADDKIADQQAIYLRKKALEAPETIR